MGTLLTVVVAIVGGLFAVMALMQVLVRLRAKAQTGKPVPSLPGPLGKHVSKGRRALVYFHSPGCAACRTFTPQLQELSRKNPMVHLVDVSRDLETAQALKVMATPSFVEIDEGKVTGFHVGPAPAEVMARYAAT
ncbi:MAG: thioredoxin family protein [Deltaproteobacteria bacterium]|nr:thioredoxin family protein [Deltaproteobacteria bacterium]